MPHFFTSGESHAMFQVAFGWEDGLQDVKRKCFTYESYPLNESIKALGIKKNNG